MSKKKRKAKRKYFPGLLSNARKSEDKSATWNIINGVLGRKEKTRVYPDKAPSPDHADPSDQKHIADALNKHFVSVAENLANKLPKTDIKHSAFMGKENKSSMFLAKIELSEIIEIIKNICIGKAMGNDKISPKIIKWAPNYLPLYFWLYLLNA